jgi:hypothetical protein
MKLKHFISLLILSTLSVAVIAGPLGMDKGMKLSDLQKLGKFTPSDEPHWYKSRTLRDGHDAFESYEVLVSPSRGLCKIIAIGKNVISNSFGEQLIREFRSLEEPLSNKYGKPDRQFNFLNSGSIWSESNDWMMGLLKEERTLTTYWKLNSNPDKLQSISINARALSGSKGWINLAYEFDNSDKCTDDSRGVSNNKL